MRGQRALFEYIFPEKQVAAPSGKGRNPELVALRNACLVDRYYFVAKEKGLRYDLLIKEIAETFFLSEITAAEIVQERLDQLRELKANAPNKAYFIRRWPALNW